MTPVKMLFGPGSNEAGDCFRAVIATLLDLPATDVPHFFEARDPQLGWAMVDTFLRSHNLAYVTTFFGFDLSVREFAAHYLTNFMSGAYLIVGGYGIGGNHVVIYRDGEMVFDPSWFNTGLTGPVRTDGDPPHYVVGILVPLNMVAK